MQIKKKSNVISIEFDNYCNIVAPALVQYDTGQILELIDVNDGVEVQFCNKNSKETTNKVVENGQVEVPDFLLQEALLISAYVQVINADSSTTVKTVTIPVMSKTKPGEYVAPEDEQTFREYVEGIMNDTKAIAEEAKESIENFKLSGEQMAEILSNIDTYDKDTIDTKLGQKVTVFEGNGQPSGNRADFANVKLGDIYKDKNNTNNVYMAIVFPAEYAVGWTPVPLAGYLNLNYYTQAQINDMISAITSLDLKVVDFLPTSNISTTTIYLVPKHSTEEQNYYDEYIYVNNAWEHIGSTAINMSEYDTSEVVDAKIATAIGEAIGDMLGGAS